MTPMQEAGLESKGQPRNNSQRSEAYESNFKIEFTKLQH